MKANYILTAFSPAMFGQRATVHIRMIPIDEAKGYIDDRTQVMATRLTHERLARNVFPNAARSPVRYADVGPGVVAIHLHYRGPPLDDTGVIPDGASVSAYLIEVEEYQDDQ